MLGLAGCTADDRGLALDLLIEIPCHDVSDLTATIKFNVEATPPVKRPNFSFGGPGVFADPGRSNRFTLLFPEGTSMPGYDPVFAAPHEENRNCRTIVIAD